MEMAGLGKIEAVVAGSEAGLYRLLRGAISYPSAPSAPPIPKKVCHTLSATISCSPPGVWRCCTKASNPAVKDVKQVLEAPSPAAFPASEEALPTHIQHLCIQLGGIKRVYRCWVEGCTEEPSTSHATICAHVCRMHLGMELMCPSCGKSFFNPDTLRHHRKSHLNQ